MNENFKHVYVYDDTPILCYIRLFIATLALLFKVARSCPIRYVWMSLS